MSGRDPGSRGRSALIVVLGALAAFVVFTAQGEQASVSAVAAPPAKGEPSGSSSPGREVASLRTRTSKTFVDEQGKLTARIFAGSAHHQLADGSWASIDNTLVKTQSGFRNKANNYAADLPRNLTTAVRFTHDAHWVSFRLVGAKAGATTAGAVATYKSAFPGVDVRYTAGSDALKEDLVLAGRSSRRDFSFAVQAAAGLTPRLRESGVVEFVDAGGVPRLAFAAPVMIDAAGAESRAVAFALAESASGWTLGLRAADEWLDDPERAWPVTIDPQVGVGAASDCSLDEDTPETSGCTTSTLKLGWDATGKQHRPLLRFDAQGALPTDVDVFSATLSVYATSQTSGTAAPMTVAANRVTRSWTSAASWNRHDGTSRWGSPGGDYDSSVEQDARSVGGTSGVARWYYFKLDDVMGAWVKGRRSQHGVILRDKATSGTNLVSIAAAESTDSSKRPHVDVRYNRRIGVQRGYALETQKLSDRIELSVNPANGNLILRQNDLTVPGGLGPDLTISRTYNSLYPVDPAYGYGWTMDTANDVRLYDHGNGNQYLDGPTGWTAGFKVYWDANGVKRYTTPKGFDATLAENADGSHTLTYHQSQDKWHFEAKSDGFARLTKTEDRNGRAITYAYYGTTNNVQTITDNQNRNTTFGTYSGVKVTTMTDPAGRVYNYGYTGENLTSYTSPTGTGSGTTYYQYGTQGMTKVTTPGGRVTRIEYWPVGGPNAGKVKKIIRVTDTTAQTGPTTQFDYVDRRDGSSDATVTDPSDHATRYVFNEDGRPEKVTDPLGNVQSTTYNSNANVNTYTAPGNSTGSANATFNYDANNNFTGSTIPVKAGDTTTNAPSLKTSTVYPGKTSTGGAVTGGTYLPQYSINEQDRATSWAYRPDGNLEQVVRNDNSGGFDSQVTLGYATTGLPGKLISSTDGNGRTTSYEYDTPGNLTKITPPTGIGATTFAYNSGADLALSRISSATHATWSETFTYDSRDRPLTVTYPSTGGTVTHTYDLDGNLTQVQDSVNGTRTNTYDALNRLKTQVGPATTSFTYGYDASSNLTSVQDNYGTTEYGYDAANRAVSVYLPGIATPVKYTLNEKGHPNKITWPNGNITAQEFNDAGQMKSTCVATADNCSGTKRLQLTYTYFQHNMNRQGTLQSTVTDAAGAVTQYCYDRLDRLTRAEVATPPGVASCNLTNTSESDFVSYGYDAAGNLLDRSSKTGSGEAYAYDGANRLCWKLVGGTPPASPRSCTTPTGGITYSYNAAGNETGQTNGGTGSRTASTYNARNQLSAFTVGGTTTNLAHFGAGQSDLLTAGGVTRRNSSLGILSIGSDTYQRDEGGGLVSQNTASGREYFHLDALGSVRALTGSAGTTTRTFNYDPYGRDHPGSPNKPAPTTSRFGYASGEWIEQGSLYHFGERYYDPQIMRWTQPDPLLNHDDLRQANRYAYVGGDPVNNVDPGGQHCADAHCGGSRNYCAMYPRRCYGPRSYARDNPACREALAGGALSGAGLALAGAALLTGPAGWIAYSSAAVATASAGLSVRGMVNNC